MSASQKTNDCMINRGKLRPQFSSLCFSKIFIRGGQIYGGCFRVVREMFESFKFCKLVMTFKSLAWCCFLSSVNTSRVLKPEF